MRCGEGKGSSRGRPSTARQGGDGTVQCDHGCAWARGPVHSTEEVTEASKEPPNLGDKNPDFALH